MDTTPVTLCMGNRLPIVVFALIGEGNVSGPIPARTSGR